VQICCAVRPPKRTFLVQHVPPLCNFFNECICRIFWYAGLFDSESVLCVTGTV
jgi:hypothetical protein